MNKLKNSIRDTIWFVCILDIVFIMSIVWAKAFNFANPFFIIFVVLLVFAYNCTYRLIVVFLANIVSKYVKINTAKFSISERENNGLVKLCVAKWKDKLPVLGYDVIVSRDKKDDAKIGTDSALKSNIIAEITHIFNFVLSFALLAFVAIPSITPLWWMLLIVAFLFAIILDLPFILVKRFERYNLLKNDKNL